MSEQLNFTFEDRPAIKGFPELRWTGKRPYTATQYYPAQLRETYGRPSPLNNNNNNNNNNDEWINKLYWGDNLQVMSHLLKNFRGRVDLIYIDPPFDSKADYKKKIAVKGIGTAQSDISSFEEKQYGDIWTNDEYLQFMYERLILMRELLSDTGSIYLHCDWHKSHYLRILMDEVFGGNNFINEIVWFYPSGSDPSKCFNRKHDVIFWYVKNRNSDYVFNFDAVVIPYTEKQAQRFKEVDENGLRFYWNKNPRGETVRTYMKSGVGEYDVWNIGIDASLIKNINYPTAKPPKLLERIILASSNPGDLVFDCFMGSGTTQAVAMKLGRRFLGADINLGAIQTTTKRLINLASELKQEIHDTEIFTGFEVYNVNNYDFFRNPVEARSLILKALEIQEFPRGNLWDGELDGRMVKIMPSDRIATKADLMELIANLPYSKYEKLSASNPNQPVEKILLVCMGHEPDLKARLQQEVPNYKLDIEIRDILRDRADIQLKRDSEAEIVKEGRMLVIREFYPLNLMQKLSLQKEYFEDWRQLVDSIMIDWNYDGAVMQPAVTDIPGKNELVSGVYEIPEGAGTIKIKITDLLSESFEEELS